MFPTSKESSSTRLVNIESSASPQAVSEFRDGYESGRSNENSTVDLKMLFSNLNSKSDIIPYAAFKRTLALGSEYLGGVWKNVLPKNVIIEPIE
ncbi:unnamed protein product [Dracunculus medinensis]|uniref:Uncharacterized protein n=1 Tax=Dracunculus medinensis TaxID=318479 RepID=A0A0N4U4Z1_DRAME|nr:unnamed protein product [Dracunculus medinensis]